MELTLDTRIQVKIQAKKNSIFFLRTLENLSQIQLSKVVYKDNEELFVPKSVANTLLSVT